MDRGALAATFLISDGRPTEPSESDDRILGVVERRRDCMHGLLVEVSIEAGREADSVEFLKANVVPRVREAPGFVSAYWWTSGSGTDGWGLTIFETEEAAKAAAEMAASNQIPMPDFVSMGSQEVVRINATA
jgi:hypothetical protein